MRYALNDLRSLELGRWYAEHLDEAMVERGRQRLARWLEHGRIHPERARTWNELLSRPIADIRDVLTAEDEQSAMLRLHAPFAGEMPARERAALFRRTAAHWKHVRPSP